LVAGVRAFLIPGVGVEVELLKGAFEGAFGLDDIIIQIDRGM
jgi:hypothetical protein